MGRPEQPGEVRGKRSVFLPAGGCKPDGSKKPVHRSKENAGVEITLPTEQHSRPEKRVVSLLRYGPLAGGMRRDINSISVQRRSVSPSAMAGVR